MNSQDFNNSVTASGREEALMTGISWFYSQFIQGDINEQEFSDLIDLQIEFDRHAFA